MINFLQLYLKQIAFNYKASNGKGHGVHSPFVYQFITEILNDNRFFYAYELIENQKQVFTSATKKLGNKKHAENILAMIHHLPDFKYHSLLFRIVHFYNQENILEIGSSLGITTAYLSKANENNQVVSIVETTIQNLLSKENLKELNIKNATVIHSPDLKFTLSDIGYKKFGIILFNMSQIHHEIELSDILRITNENSIFIFFSQNESIKDNHFWNKLKIYPNTSIYIQLFSMKLAFFRKEQHENEHYTIQF